jgi:hypothetical protein
MVENKFFKAEILFRWDSILRNRRIDEKGLQ